MSEDHAVAIHPIIQNQVEIIRGPAILRYGSQAIGGVVNTSNNRIPDQIAAGGFYRVDSKYGHTTVDDGNEGALIVEGGAGSLAFHGDLYKRKTGDYEIPGFPGVQANSGTNTEGGALGGSIVFDNGFIGASISRHKSLYYIPGEEAAERNLRIDLNQKQYRSEGGLVTNGALLESVRYWYGYTDYEHDEIEEEVEGEIEIGSTFLNGEHEARVETRTRKITTPFGPMTTALGAQYVHRRLSATGEGGDLLEPNETENIAGFIFNEIAPAGGIRFQFASRVENANVQGVAGDFPPNFLPPPDEVDEAAFDLNFVPISGSAGVLVDLPYDVVASLNGQYVERAPDALELFAQGPHEATETFEIGDPKNGIEAARTAELGFKRGKGAFRFEANVYYTEFDGFIFKRITGEECGDEFETCGLEDELTQIVYTQQDATFYGTEIAGEQDLLPVHNGTVGVDGQYDYVRGYFVDGTNVPHITPMRAGGGMYYRDGNIFARVGALHAFRQDNVAVNETPTSGYTLLTGTLNYTAVAQDDSGVVANITLGVTGQNLLDDEVRNHVSFKKEDVLLPGRGFKLHGRVLFN